MGTLYINGEIGYDVTARTVLDFLKAHDGKELDVTISSYGGDVNEGMLIYDALQNSGKTITARIVGHVASAASFIAMVADKIIAVEDSQMMIHNAWTGFQGNKEELAKTQEFLTKIDDSIALKYVNRTGLSEEAVKGFMTEETWFTAEQMIEHGFADEIEKIKAYASYNVNSMDNKELKEQRGLLTKIWDKLKNEAEEPKNMAVELSDGGSVWYEEGSPVLTEEGGEPVEAGEYELADGRTMVVGENGEFVEYKEAEEEEEAVNEVESLKTEIENLKEANTELSEGFGEIVALLKEMNSKQTETANAYNTLRTEIVKGEIKPANLEKQVKVEKLDENAPFWKRAHNAHKILNK